MEKEVKNVLLLASWKDTNIDSLKQSAKASHRKLFKVVRTFRQALRQPVALSLDQFPDKASVVHAQTTVALRADESSSPQSSDILKSWKWLPARFRNANSTVEMIQLIYSRSEQCVRSSPRLESFLGSLLHSINDLQQQTPKLLKEENEDLVKHLKSQKRVLFAATLKELREMGLSTNPTTATLRDQDDICSIVARIPVVSSSVRDDRWGASDYFFHKVLTTLPDVRQISSEHSGDLTSSEVARCVGIFESLLSHVVQQRTHLAHSLNDLNSLEQVFHLVHTVSVESTIHHDRAGTCSGLRGNYLTSRRLSASCVGIRSAISAQGELGQLDTKRISDELDNWSRTFSEYSTSVIALENYPADITSSPQSDTYQLGQRLFDEFESALDAWSGQSPQTSPVLDHLIELLQECRKASNVESSPKANRTTVDDFGHVVLSFLDLLLGAIQDLEGANSKLPGSEETPRWLVTESKVQTAAISALRLSFLQERLEMIVDSLQNVQDEQLRTAVAALTALRPILRQFQDVASQVIEEFSSLHLSTAKMLHHLSASLLTIGKDGFCTPPEETTGGNDGEKLEGGDIFGDGEGAENVSGEMNEDDIASDTEAEPKQNETSGNESDHEALDADDSDMEGKTEDGSDAEDKTDEESEPELDEDVGDVDEGEPSKIDEKRWDDGASSEKKAVETAETNNAQQSEDQVANEGQDKPEPGKEESNSPDHASPENEDEEITQNELDDGDDHVQDSNNLDLPDDINLDSLSQNDDMNSDDDDLNDESGSEASSMDVDDAKDDEPTRDQDDVTMADVDENVMDVDETSDEAEQDDKPLPQPDEAQNSDPNTGAEAKSADQSNATDRNTTDKRVPQKNPAEYSTDREENEDVGMMDAEQQISANEDDNQGDTKNDGGFGRAETAEHPTVESMKKLGDIMEDWVRQSRPIQASQDNAARASMADGIDTDNVDFEHIEDDSEADAQAMDTATREEATALDQNMDSHADQSREWEDYRAMDPETQELKNPRRQLNSAQDQAENKSSFIGSNSRSDHPEEQEPLNRPTSTMSRWTSPTSTSTRRASPPRISRRPRGGGRSTSRRRGRSRRCSRSSCGSCSRRRTRPSCAATSRRASASTCAASSPTSPARTGATRSGCAAACRPRGGTRS